MAKLNGKFLVCSDCIMTIETGENTHLDYSYSGDALSNRIGNIQRGVDALSEYGSLHAGGEHIDFSWSACECCGLSLAGSRHEIIALASEAPQCLSS